MRVQGPLEGCQRQFELTGFDQNAAQVGASFHVVFVQLDGHRIPFAGRRDISGQVEQLCQAETDFGAGATGDESRSIHLNGSREPPGILQIRRLLLHFVQDQTDCSFDST